MKKTSIKFWLCLTILLGFAALSIAYVLLDYKWPVGTDVIYHINANTAQVADEEDAVKNAADTWSQIYPAGLRLTYGGATSVATKIYNGLNNICWENEGGSGVLATAWIWYSGSTILETDMVFNDFYNWSTSGIPYDIETVALHEFGHWVGLDHSSSGIMQPSYSGIQRSIDSDAEAGFNALYGGGGGNPSIELDRGTLSFSGDQEKTFNVRNSGAGTLDYQISDDREWMSVSPEGGNSTGEWDVITVTVDTSGLSDASYSGTVSIASNNAINSPQSLAVDLTISQRPTASIELDRNSLSFTGNQEKTFNVRNSGAWTLDYQISDDREWMSVSPESGSSTGEWDEITVTVNASGLSVGEYSGLVSVSSNNADNSPRTLTVHLTIEDEPPSVSITSPQNGALVSRIVTVSANASDDVGIKKVEFYIDNGLKATDTSSPYEWSWDTTLYSSGAHTVKAKAYDTIDQTAEDSIEVIVDQPPEVSITTPSSGSYVSGEVTVQASASDDVRIKKVEFYLDNGLKATDTSSPYEWSWDTTLNSSGAHTIKAKAYDSIDQTAEDSISLTVDQPPEVSITMPSSGSYVSGEVTVQASASDDVGIKKVEFYINGALENTDTESPYNFNWNTNSVFNGFYSIKVIVYDTRNQTDNNMIDVIRIPHAPSNFSGKKHNNSSTLLEQYINELTWQADEMNRDIGKFRIYQKDGEEQVLLVELDASTFEYRHMNVDKDKKYTYVIKAVDSDNREGESAYLEIQ